MSLRRPLKIAAIALAVLAAIPLVALFVLWGAANTQAGRSWIEAALTEALSSPGAPAEVAGLSGALSQTLRLERLVLRDGEGAWLRLEGLHLAWQPGALLGGRLRIAELRADRIRLDRLPAAPPTPPDAPEPEPDDTEFALEIPELPLGVRLRRLAVDRLELGQAVLGTAAVFEVTGRAAAEDGRTLTSRLMVERVDGPKGRFRAEATYDRDSTNLDLVVALDAAQGGLVAQLLDLPQAGGSTVRLTGTGPVRDWRGTLEARFGDGAQVSAQLGLQELRRATASGRLQVGGLLDPTLRPLAGGPIEFDLAAERRGANGVALTRGRLENATARIELQGGIEGDGTQLDATADVAVTDPAPFEALAAPARFRDLHLRLSARGALAGPQIDLEVRAARIGTPEATLTDAEVAAAYAPGDSLDQGRVTLRVNSPSVGYGLPQLAGFDGRPLAIDVAGDLDLTAMQLSAAQAEIALDDLRLRLDGGADLAGGTGDAAFTLEIPDLARLDPAIGLGLTGRGTLTGHAMVTPGAPMLQATLAGDLQEVGPGTGVLGALVHGRVELASDLQVSPEGALDLRGLSLASPSARIDGNLSFPADFATIAGELAGRVPDAGALSEALGVPLAGGADLTARLSGPTEDPSVAARLTLADAAIAGTALGRLKLDAEVDTVASGVTGTLQVETGDSPVGALRLRTRLAMQPDAFVMKDLRADGPGLSLRDGRLAVSLSGGALTGGARIASDDLARPLATLAGLDAGGRADLELELSGGPDGGQRVQLDGRLDGLALGGGTRADSVDLTARIDRAFAGPRGSVRVAVSGAGAGPAAFESLSLTAEGGPDGLDVELRGSGELYGAMQLAADARLRQDGKARELALSRLDLEIGERRIALDRTATLRQGADGLSLDDLVLRVGEGRLTLRARSADGRVQATLDAGELPLAYSRILLAQPKLEGKLDATARLEGPLDAPTGSLNLRLRELGTEDTDLPPVDAWLNSTLREGRYVVSGQLGGLTETPIQLSGSVPFDLALDPVRAGVPSDAELQGEVRWAGQVAPLMPLVPASGHRLTGQADIAFILGGTPESPDLYGRVVLKDAAYENLTTGTLLTDLALTVVATGERVEVSRFEADDGGNGKLSLTGGVAFNPERGFPLSVQFDSTDAKLVRLDYLTADMDSDIEVEGSLQDMLVSGRVTVQRAEVRPPSGLPPEVAELNVVTEQELAEREQARRAGEAPPPEQPSRVRLDVKVDMPGQVFVRGSGLDSEWGGQLQVTGTAAQPRVTGQIAARRGRLDFLSKPFRVERGTIAFDGGREINPTIDIAAVNRSDELIATVNVSGQASSPSIELSSQPPLPQDEVLARLLFGKSASNLSALEAAQLGTAVAELSLSGGGPGVLDRLRSFVGVDVLRLGSSGGTSGTGSETDPGTSATPTVEAGKYVTDNVFVGVEQGATAESSQVKVEVEVTDNIFVESDVGATGTGNIGVKFKWDY